MSVAQASLHVCAGFRIIGWHSIQRSLIAGHLAITFDNAALQACAHAFSTCKLINSVRHNFLQRLPNIDLRVTNCTPKCWSKNFARNKSINEEQLLSGREIGEMHTDESTEQQVKHTYS